MKLNLFQKTALITVIATLVLILVGGLVRAAGAGLGCPDWPRCFGMWIPPLSAEDLPSQFNSSLFNPYHTWIEYINRLMGVLIGLLITLTFAFSLKYRKKDPVIVWASAAAFILVLFQGWLGGQVVRSGLSAGMITIHMVVAMVIVNVLLYATFRAMSRNVSISLSTSAKKTVMIVSGVLLFFTLVQLVLGTQVRESVDVAKNIFYMPRPEWLDSVGVIYEIHRSFSWVIVLLGGVLLYINKKLQVPPILSGIGWTIAGLLILQIFAGVGMERLGMPGVLQVIHLVSVAVLICAEFLYMLIAGFSETGPD
ncbi:MAG: COX15/CtaA family protein [Balneolaceae bacterium]